jgi:hypothetical protein
MKKAIFLTTTLFTLFFLTSCEKANKNLTGTWNMTENCNPSGAAGPYVLTFTPDGSDEYKFTIQGLWEEPAAVTICTLSTSNKLEFTAVRQTLSPGFEIEVNTGSINSSYNAINFTYSVYNTGSVTVLDGCTASATPN